MSNPLPSTSRALPIALIRARGGVMASIAAGFKTSMGEDKYAQMLDLLAMLYRHTRG